MKYPLFLLVILVFFSCSSNMQEEKNMVFYEFFPRGKVWIENQEIDLEELRELPGRSRYICIAFDSINSRLWALSMDNDDGSVYFYDLTNGVVSLEDGIKFEMLNQIALTLKINNNKALVLSEGYYEILNLITKERIKIQIPKDDNGSSPMSYNSVPLGFTDNEILFWNGYYSILEKKYSFYPIGLNSPRFIPEEQKIVAFDKDNFIILHDIKSGYCQKTSVQRKKFNPTLTYTGEDLFFLEEGFLYFSEDTFSFSNIFAFIKKPAQRKWYKYSFSTEEKSEIAVPSNYSTPLGRVCNRQNKHIWTSRKVSVKSR